MKFTFNNKEYRIKFRHQLPTTKLVKYWAKQGHNTLWIEKLIPGWTECTVELKNPEDEYVDPTSKWCKEMAGCHAYAYQSKKDPWNKEMGRQVSLGKALKGCDKEFVKAAEGAYYGRKKMEGRKSQHS